VQGGWDVKLTTDIHFVPRAKMCDARPHCIHMPSLLAQGQIYVYVAKFHKKTRIKLYNTLALPILLYGSETWTIKAKDARRITAAEMIYMRKTAVYTWIDYKTYIKLQMN
jgi:hypothetical protein